MFQFSPQLGNLANLMNAAELRHRVLSQNLANVNTPGYQRQEVVFEELLGQMVKEQGSQRVHAVTPQVRSQGGLSTRADGNNVDIDQEIGQMNRNSLAYQTYSQVLASQFEMLRRATRGA